MYYHLSNGNLLTSMHFNYFDDPNIINTQKFKDFLIEL